MITNWYKIAQDYSNDTYTVVSGDTLSGIAQKTLGLASKASEIAKINPQIKDINKIEPGMIINIPRLFKDYVVVNGDTLSGIAKKMLGDMLKWKELQEINNIVNPDSLNVGQVIKIPDNVVSRNATVSKQPAVSPKNNSNTPFSGDPLEALKIEISKGEGGYNSYNRGIAGDSTTAVLDITQMTINEIMTKQSTKFSNGKRELFAVGRYQMIPVTLAEAVKNKKLGVSSTDLFSPETQEKLFMHLIYKRPYLIG